MRMPNKPTHKEEQRRVQNVIVEGEIVVDAQWIDAMAAKMPQCPLIVVRKTAENVAIAIGYEQVIAYSSPIDSIHPLPAIVPELRVNQQDPEALSEFLKNKMLSERVPEK